MSLVRDPFDKQAQELLHDHEVQPPVHAWSAIEARLDQSAKRPPIVWWSLGALLLIGLVVWETSRADVENAPQVVSTSTAQKFAALTPPPKQPEETPATVIKALPDQVSPEQLQKANLSASTQRQRVKLTSQPSYIPASPPTSSNPQTNDGGVALAIQANQDVSNSKARIRIPIASQRVDRTSLKLPALDEMPERIIPRMPSLAGKRAIPCPDFKKSSDWVFGLRATLGPAIQTRDWSTARAGERAPYFALRDSMENQQLDLLAAVRVEATSGKGLFVSVGAMYDLQRQRVELLGASRRSTTLDTLINPAGQVVRIDTLVSITTLSSTFYNRTHMLGAIAGIGWRKPDGNLRPYVLLEYGYGVALASRGQRIRPSGELVDLSSSEGSNWVAKNQWRRGIALGADLLLNSKLGVGLSARGYQMSTDSGIDDPLVPDRRFMGSLSANAVWTF